MKNLVGFRKYLFNLAQILPRNEFAFRFSLVLRKIALSGVQSIDCKQFGLHWRYWPHDNLADRFAMFSPKYYEDEERAFLDDELKPGHVFLDIGANIGFYSLYVAYLIQKGKVIAFEPNPEVRQRFEVNLSLNPHLRSFIEILPIGLADQEGFFQLSVSESNQGAASIIHPMNGKTLTIPCRPLLDILRELNIECIDCMKIDVEGAEQMILQKFFHEAPLSLYPNNIIIESPQGID